MALEFARPGALFLLAALPLVVWLHRERTLRRDTDRLGVWERALARVPRARRRRWTARLLAALVVFVALVLAVAGLRRGERPGFREALIVLDASASMQTRDCVGRDGVRRSRRACALQAIRSRLADLPEHVLRVFYALRGARLERLESIESVAPMPSTMANVHLVQALAVRSTGRGAVFAFGDGAGPSAWPKALAANVFLRGFGAPDTRNVGIVGVHVTDPWPGPLLTVELAVRGKPLPDAVSVARGAGPVEPAAWSLVATKPATSPAHFRVQLARGAGGPITLRVASDAFAADDAVQLVVREPWAPAMMTLPEGDAALEVPAHFLEQAIAAHAVATRAELVAASEAQLLLVEGGSLRIWPKDGVTRVLFGTALPGLTGEQAFRVFPEWDRGHPLLAGLDLSAVRGESARRRSGALPKGVEVLAWLDGQPFVVLSPQHALLWFGCDAATSNLTRQPFLPILILRALRSLVGERSGAPSVSGLLSAAESDVRARPAPPPKGEPRFVEPALELWTWLLAVALAAFVLRLAL